MKRRSIQPMLAAAMKNHPSYASRDFSWFKPLIDRVPFSGDSERIQSKAERYVENDTLEEIPGKIRARRESYERKATKDTKRIAQLAREELMMRGLLILPWRQRNLQKCRISGPAPNLFRGRIPPSSDLDRSAWVTEEEATNPNTEFWLIRLSSGETKTGLAMNVLLPRQLIVPVEQYVAKYRPYLLAGRKTETLFLNQLGKPMRADQVEKVVGRRTLQFGGVRTTPHLFRDAVAFKWLKEQTKDYLARSNMFWHRNVRTRIQIYGARYSESSGVCAVEARLEAREAKPT